MEASISCEACGAELEHDSKFCNRCGAPVAGAAGRTPARDAPDEDEGDGADDADEADEPSDSEPGERGDGGDDLHAQAAADDAARPKSRGSASARIFGIVAALALIALGIVKLANRPTVRFEVIEIPDPGLGVGAAPTEVPRESAPERAPTDAERALAGTWVATVGFDAPRPAAAGATLVQLQALREGLGEPVRRCIWLELYDNLRGFQHECGVVDGEPSVLEQTDPASGRTTPVGAAFRWSFERGALTLTYDEDMIVSTSAGTTRFTRTVLAIPGGSPPFDVQQSFPEHPDAAPLALRFEVLPGRYLGDDAP